MSKYIDSKLIEDTFVNIFGIIVGYLINKLYLKNRFISDYFFII